LSVHSGGIVISEKPITYFSSTFLPPKGYPTTQFSMMEAEDVQAWLNNWIGNYVNANKQSGPELRYTFPLADASIKVEPVPGKPGSYHAIAWLKPWLQMEELTTSMRLVANIPGG
jgi:type VI secretion system protein ImpC